MRRRRAVPRAAGVALVSALLAGCGGAPDEETVPRPARTVTATVTPSPQPVALPSEVPVGSGAVGPGDAVWAQDSTLHVGTRQVDLAPLGVDSFVVVPGGVYFLDRGELWFTDLARARGTGITGVTGLAADQDGTAILVETGGGGDEGRAQGYDATTGSAVPPEDVEPATVEDRLGPVDELVLRPARSDVTDRSGAPVRVRTGPGRFGVVGGDGERLVLVDVPRRQRVPVSGTVGDGFELVGWTGPASVFGLALDDARPSAVVECDAEERRCTRLGRVDAGRSLVFESGT